MTITTMKEGAAFTAQRLIFSAGTLPNAGFLARVQAASDAGFDAISLFPAQYLSAISTEKLTLLDMRKILFDHGIALDEVDPLLDWFGPGASRSEQLLVEMAQGLGARSVNVPTAFVSNKPHSELVECFGMLCERMRMHGLRVDLEFLPWTAIPDLSSALSVLNEVRQGNAGVMLDFWHFFNSGATPDSLDDLPIAEIRQITSIQLNDVPHTIDPLDKRQQKQYSRQMLRSLVDNVRVMGLRTFISVALTAKYPHASAQNMMRDSLCSRRFPGEGDKDVVGLLKKLAQAGVCPATGIEVFNLQNVDADPRTIAGQAIGSYRAVAERT